MSITPKNWAQFQHYKDRKPPWIKLHHALLDDYSFSCLPDASRALAPCLWLLASEYNEGKITASMAEIAFRLHMTETKLKDALIPLVHKGFFIASDTLSERKQTSMPERETEEETEIEKEIEKEATGFRKPVLYSETFLDFWKPYPRTPVMSKKEAAGAWKRLSEADQQAAIAALPAYKAFLASKPDHPAVHACRFLSQRRFDGFAAEPKPQSNGGWRPGLPTEDELRAKYAEIGERIRKTNEQYEAVVEGSPESRPHERQLVCGEAGKRGTQSLGEILRKTGLVSNVLSEEEKGNNPALPMAGMDERSDS